MTPDSLVTLTLKIGRGQLVQSVTKCGHIDKYMYNIVIYNNLWLIDVIITEEFSI